MAPPRHNDRLFRCLATALVAGCLAMLLMAGSASAGGARAPGIRRAAAAVRAEQRVEQAPCPGTRAIDPDSQQLVDYLNQEVNREEAAHIGAVDHGGQLQHPALHRGPEACGA